jgi:hypothetical protein
MTSSSLLMPQQQQQQQQPQSMQTPMQQQTAHLNNPHQLSYSNASTSMNSSLFSNNQNYIHLPIQTIKNEFS